MDYTTKRLNVDTIKSKAQCVTNGLYKVNHQRRVDVNLVKRIFQVMTFKKYMFSDTTAKMLHIEARKYTVRLKAF